MEVLSDREKKHRILSWRVWQGVGWTVVILLNLFYVYWLSVFTNEFPIELLDKWFAASVQSLLVRFLFAPFCRGGLFCLILLLSRCGPCCDICLVLWPQILLAGQLENYDPGSIDFAFQDDVDLRDLEFTDVDYGL
jgi:hypothetical protein